MPEPPLGSRQSPQRVLRPPSRWGGATPYEPTDPQRGEVLANHGFRCGLGLGSRQPLKTDSRSNSLRCCLRTRGGRWLVAAGTATRRQHCFCEPSEGASRRLGSLQGD